MSIHIKIKPATMGEKQAHARRLAYLGNVSTIMAHLANEYGTEVTLPSRKFVEMVIMERKAQQTVTAMRRGPASRVRFRGSVKA